MVLVRFPYLLAFHVLLSLRTITMFRACILSYMLSMIIEHSVFSTFQKPLLRHYISKETSGIICVIDSTDPDRLEEFETLLSYVLDHDEVCQTPVVFMLNKQDLATKKRVTAEHVLALPLVQQLKSRSEIRKCKRKKSREKVAFKKSTRSPLSFLVTLKIFLFRDLIAQIFLMFRFLPLGLLYKLWTEQEFYVNSNYF